jgi:4-aminobutyrate aminotransferase-like enzyme
MLAEALAFAPEVEIRGAGLMIGIDLAKRAGGARAVLNELLARGYLATAGGGGREVLVLTPSLAIEERLLALASEALGSAVSAAS